MRQLNQMIASFSTKQLLLLTSVVCCYWVYTWWSVAGLERRSSAQLREDILALSDLYVRALAREQKEVVDGPYSGRLTASDFKRTVAVLLQTIMDRLDRLEKQAPRLGNLSLSVANGSAHLNFARSSVRAHSRTKEEPWIADAAPSKVTCSLSGASMTNTMRALWPECEEKLEWMRRHWRSDACYANYGVDGSTCSFFYFLSEVENFCPRISSKQLPLARRAVNHTQMRLAEEDSSAFFALASQVRGPFARSFRSRTARLWLHLSSAGMRLLSRSALSPSRPRLRIAIFSALLADVRNPAFPLELAEETRQLMVRQFADLTAALFQLGHDVTLCTSLADLQAVLKRFPDAKSPCQARKNLFLDLLYTDHVGLALFRHYLGANRFSRFNCLLRVLDPFGTEPSFNFFRACRACGFNLSPKQYLTLTPADLTPDNSFLGLVVLPSDPAELSAPTAPPDRPLAILHLTRHSLPPSRALLAALRRHFRVFPASLDAVLLPETAEVVASPALSLSWSAYTALLREASLFVGLGLPVDSPVALLALAAGCRVLNPLRAAPVPLEKLQPGWPSGRVIQAQFTYLWRHFRPPLVYSWAPGEPLETLLASIATSPRLDPFVPAEFGPEAFLQRLDLFVQRQELCEGTTDSLGASGSPAGRVQWPPASAVLFYLGLLGDSCEETCRKRSQICEPAHFAGINSRIELQERGIRCDRIAFEAAAENPHFQPPSSACTFQSEPRLFSCAGARPHVMRLCPCRDALPQQSALCSRCL